MKRQLIIIGIIILLLAVGFSGCFENEIKTTDMSVEEIKSNAINVSYNDLMRNIEEHTGKTVYFRGRVLQVLDYDSYYTLRIATGLVYYLGYTDDVIAVNYKGPRILKDDIVDVWGYVKGIKTYTTVLGAQVTIPELDCFHLELLD